MKEAPPDHTLEFLLAFDGRVHWLEDDYHLRFEIRRVAATPSRPLGLRYSFTLHDPGGKRLVGFDNAHSVRPQGANRKRPKTADHWHRTGTDKGRPYKFTSAEQLLADFFAAANRTLAELGIPTDVVGVTDERSDT